MPLASFILSLCLHVAGLLLIWLWPVGEPLISLEKPVLISLVEGEPGGNNTPSPILGHMGKPDTGELAPSPPAEKAEVAAQAREEIKAAPDMEPLENKPPVEEPKKPDIQPVPVPVQPEPKKEEPKKEEPKKEEPKKEEPKKPEPKKEEPKKAPPKEKKPEKNKEEKKDAVKAALDQAKRKATSRAESGDKGSSVERALAEARRKASGTGGGGGGQGTGPGGGLNAVYIGQVMLAVRPNWGYASSTRQNLQCTILINVTAQGEVQTCKVVRSSGNVQYDSSCVNAIMRTSRAGDFPPPPTPDFQNLEMVFTLNELRGR